MKQSKLFTVFTALLLACIVLTASIAAPILCRPFYYAHIAPLGLEEYTGLSQAEITHAYDEMLDFCLGLRTDFSTGVLPWSESGKAHFEDVRALFLLDLRLLAATAGLLLLLLLFSRQKLRPYRFGGHGPGFWAAIGLICTLLLVGILAATDFDRAFTVFHRIFFPGKDNWLFDWRTDAVILILPQTFFRNCALFIGGVLAALCGVLIVLDRPKKHG